MSQATATATKRAVIYARISKDDRRDELGVKRQEKLCRELATRLGWTVIDVYVDDNLSAYKKHRRPQYDRLMTDIRSGHVDSVLAYNPDRLCRDDLRGIEDMIDVLNEFGVTVETVRSGTFDLSNADGRANARQGGVWARRESEKMSERLRDKHAELVAEGHPNGGRRPLGYRRDRQVGEDGQMHAVLTVDEDEAPVVRELIRRVAAGETLTGVADDLNARGLTTSTGGPWTLWTVRRVATNGLYAGRRIHNGEDVGPGTWPALVDEATWRRAVAILHSPDRAQRRTARRYLLVGGIIRCGKCGAAMRSKPYRQRNGGGTLGTYVCPPKKDGGCGGMSVRADALDQLVTEALIDRVESKAFAKALRSREGVDKEAAAEVTRLTRQLKGLAAAMESGALSLSEYVRFRDARTEQLAEAQARMTGDTTTAAVGRFASRPGALRDWWDDEATTLDQRQAVVRAVVDRVDVAPVGKGGGNRFNPDRVTVVAIA